jgi:hypothetical protein
MSSTGFIVSGYGDLSTILKPITSTAGPATNFIASDGYDLNEWFEMSATPGNANADQIQYDTNYDMSYNGTPTDLRYMFQNINYNPDPISFTPSSNFVLVQSGSNYILSCITNSGTTNTVTFNVGISNVNFVIVGGGGGGGSSNQYAENGGGGGEGGQTVLTTLGTVQTSNYVTLIIGNGGASSTNGNSSTVNYILGGMTFIDTANPGVKGSNATDSSGGTGGSGLYNGGNGGRGGNYLTNVNAVNGSASDQTAVNIFGTNYYFGGGGGGGSYDQQSGSSFGGLGGGKGGGNGQNGNNKQIYTTPYNVSYNPATTNSFPNSGGGGNGGNGNGSSANNPGGTGNSGIIVIYFTYP